MKNEELQQVLAWVRGTDLVEVSFKDGSAGFSFETAGPAAPNYPVPASRFQAVTSPAVGVFRAGPLGRGKKAEEGVEVAEGQVLGTIEGGVGKPVEIKSPCAGRLAKVFIQDGSPAEYGLPLMMVEPR